MAKIWADSTDVLALWVGPKAPVGVDTQIDTLCGIAESVVKGEFPTLVTRAAADPDLANRAKLVVVQMIQALYRNPGGMKYFQRSTGPFLQAGNFGDALLKMMALTDDQRAMLVSSTRHRGGMVDFDPSPTLVLGSTDIVSTL